MNPRRIVIDGKSYNSVDEMPEDVRWNYEEAMRGLKEPNPAQGAAGSLSTLFADGDHDGVPDIMEKGQVINLTGGMKFVVDGQTYNSLETLPPEARAKYEQAMGAIDRNQNGMPDFLEGMMNGSAQSAPAQTAFDIPAGMPRHVSRPYQPVPHAIAPDTSNGWMLALAGLGLLFLCAAGAAGVWYFFLR
jgi:hypothetical protein